MNFWSTRGEYDHVRQQLNGSGLPAEVIAETSRSIASHAGCADLHVSAQDVGGEWLVSVTDETALAYAEAQESPPLPEAGNLAEPISAPVLEYVPQDVGPEHQVADPLALGGGPVSPPALSEEEE